MTEPKEPQILTDSKALESFDLFGQTVRERLQALAGSIDELNEKSNILEYEWVFDREDWYLYKDAIYGRCRLVSVTRNEDGTYTVVAAKAWEEDRDLLISGEVTPTQYVRYVSPKAQVAHFSEGASRILSQHMAERSARYSAGDEAEDINPYAYLYEAAFGRLQGIAGIQMPEVDIYDEAYRLSLEFRRLDIIKQSLYIKTLRLSSVRKPAWELNVPSDDPDDIQYQSAIVSVQNRSDIPDLSGYQMRYSSYDHLLSTVKAKMSRLWNKRYNIDSLFFISPGSLDPELAGLYEERFNEVIAEIEQMYIDAGDDPKLYPKAIYKAARIRIHDIEFEHDHDVASQPVVWSKQEAAEALMLSLDDLQEEVESAVDNSLIVESLYREMPAVLEPLYKRMAQLSIDGAMSTGDRALVSRFVVLPKRLTVGNNGEVSKPEQPKTMRHWVESIRDWVVEQDDEFDYAYSLHIKPDGSTLYAELRLRRGDVVTDIDEYAAAHSETVLLANFHPNAIAYLKRYHKRQVLVGSDFHRAIHVKYYMDRPMNDGGPMIEFVHNA